MSENNTNTKTNQEDDKTLSVKKRMFLLDGLVDEKKVGETSEKILDVISFDEEQKEKDKNYVAKPIQLIVNTYGGSLYDANMLIGIIETSSTPIYTYCYGKAMSAGFYVFSSGHKRFATELATFMYHDGSVGMHDTISGLHYTLRHYTGLRDRYDEYIIRTSKIPKVIMDKKKREKEDWYMTAEEALKYGIVDEIIPFRREKSE